MIVDYKESLLQIQDQKVLIWFSGGPDSVATYDIVYNFFLQQNRDISNIYLAYFDHGVREESKQESDHISNHYDNVLIGKFGGSEYDEATLRKSRWEFFDELITKYDFKFLITWHNLTDRYETTLLNMIRWSDLWWFLNMRQVEVRDRYTIIRPLLHTTKMDIQRYCDNKKLHYFVDKTNFDENISLRNKIRKYIIWFLDKINTDNGKNFWKSMDRIYEKVENLEDKNFIKSRKRWDGRLTKIDLPWFFGWELYKCEWNWSVSMFVKLFKSFGIYNNITKSKLEDLYRFAVGNNIWKKQLQWLVFYKSHWYLYFLHPNDLYNQDKVLFWWQEQIDMSWWYEYNQTDVLYLSKDLRSYKYKSKNLYKYLLNNKVPVFVRDLVPVVVDMTQNQIIHIYIDLIQKKINGWYNVSL